MCDMPPLPSFQSPAPGPLCPADHHARSRLVTLHDQTLGRQVHAGSGVSGAAHPPSLHLRQTDSETQDNLDPK